MSIQVSSQTQSNQLENNNPVLKMTVSQPVDQTIRDSVSTSPYELDRTALDKALTCDICQEIFCEPVTLFCNHTFCQTCVRQIKPAQQWDKTKKCPNCQLHIWEPCVKTVNYAMRLAVIAVIGEQAYEAKKNEKNPALVRQDIEGQVADEIRKDLWRSIADNLQKLHGASLEKAINPNDPNQPANLYTGMIGLPGMNYKKDPICPPVNPLVCQKFNTLKGCHDDMCTLIHQADGNYLWEELKYLRKKWGYDSDKQVCYKYSRLDGCSEGENCPYAHVPNLEILWNELIYLREKENSQIFKKSDTPYYIWMIAIFFIMVYMVYTI